MLLMRYLICWHAEVLRGCFADQCRSRNCIFGLIWPAGAQGVGKSPQVSIAPFPMPDNPVLLLIMVLLQASLIY